MATRTTPALLALIAALVPGPAPACPEPTPDPLFDLLFVALAALDPGPSAPSRAGWFRAPETQDRSRFAALRDQLVEGLRQHPSPAVGASPEDEGHALRFKVLFALAWEATGGDWRQTLAALESEPAARGSYRLAALERLPPDAWPIPGGGAPSCAWLLGPARWVVGDPAGHAWVGSPSGRWRALPPGGGAPVLGAGLLGGGAPGDGFWLFRRDGPGPGPGELQVLAGSGDGARELGRIPVDTLPLEVALDHEPDRRTRPLDDLRAWATPPGPAAIVTVRGRAGATRYRARAGTLTRLDP